MSCCICISLAYKQASYTASWILYGPVHLCWLVDWCSIDVFFFPWGHLTLSNLSRRADFDQGLYTPWKINGWNMSSWRFGSDNIPFSMGDLYVPAVNLPGCTDASSIWMLLVGEILTSIERDHICVTWWCACGDGRKLTFGPQNHEKWRFYTPKIWVITSKNEGFGFPWHLIWWKSTANISKLNAICDPRTSMVPWFLRVLFSAGFAYLPAVVWVMRLVKGSVALCNSRVTVSFCLFTSELCWSWWADEQWITIFHHFSLLNDEQMSYNATKWGLNTNQNRDPLLNM